MDTDDGRLGAAVASRRSAAASLSEELLADIELNRLGGAEIARKALRLARIIDDFEALSWLQFEVAGYPRDELSSDASEAACRSNRHFLQDEQEVASTLSLGALGAAIQAAHEQLLAAIDAPTSIVSANPNQFVGAPGGNRKERAILRAEIVNNQGLYDRIVGSIHVWVTNRYYEIRFGAAAEDSFAVVRATVDGLIANLVPDAVRRVAVAFENASSADPEQWANAASGCRRLIKAAADALRPPGPEVNGRKMGNDNYINRLVDWIVARSPSSTHADVVVADLQHLGKRLDSVADAGNKGAHADVNRFEASRYITGTYLLLGDILQLNGDTLDSSDVDASGKVTANLRSSNS